MKTFHVAAALFVFIAISCVARGADAGAKPAEVKGHQETLTGMLSASDGQIFLKVRTEEKLNRTKHYTLYADGDLAKQLAELAKKGSRAEVSGLVRRTASA